MAFYHSVLSDEKALYAQLFLFYFGPKLAKLGEGFIQLSALGEYE
jgi:hypothetical protein